MSNGSINSIELVIGDLKKLSKVLFYFNLFYIALLNIS